MADYSIAADARAVHNKTLVATTVDTVTCARDPRAVEILSDGAAKIYVTVDGSTPTVGGTKTWIVPAVPCARVIPHDRADAPVKLISPGTPTYSVTVV